MTPDETFAALPPALLLLGPGSWDAALSLYEANRSSFSTKVEKLDIELARYVRAQAYIKPFGREVKVILIGLDGASAAAQDTLLKLLEEPPSYVRLILAAALPPADTVVSRCRVLVQGTAPEPGTDPETDAARQTVAAAVRAARDGHAELLAATTAKWGDVHTAQLRAWAAERAADRWLQFPEDFITGVSIPQALVILAALTAFSGSRTSHLVAFDRAFRRLQRFARVFPGPAADGLAHDTSQRSRVPEEACPAAAGPAAAPDPAGAAAAAVRGRP